jgi:excisionase family DNA binding protein
VTPPRAYLRAGEIAQLCGVSLRTVRRWTASGALPSRKVGGVRLVPREALEEMISPAPPASFEEEPQTQAETAGTEIFGKASPK